MAASENLKKVDWLVSNSALLAELSPETLALMMADQGLAEEVSAKNNEAYQKIHFRLNYAGKVLLLEASNSRCRTDLEKSWDLSSEELRTSESVQTPIMDYEGKDGAAVF